MSRIAVLVDLSAIKSNVSILKKRSPHSEILLVVKADAYGHGALRVAKYCENSVDFFGVAETDEGVALRRAGVKKPILVLGAPPYSDAKTAVEYGLSLSVGDFETASGLELEARKYGNLKIHIAVDTGMNRFGFKNVSEAKKAAEFPHLEIEGVYSHFSRNDEARLEEQNENFLRLKNDFDPENAIRHIAASGALGGAFDYDMTRAGIAAYGYGEGLYPAMSVIGQILQEKRVKSGEYVGYGDIFRAEKDMKIAVISGGYADGIDRSFASGQVFIGGKRCKIVGNICMDCFFADVTDIETERGDVAVIMDTYDLNADILAKRKNTIPYEILTGFKGRAKRIYFY